MAVADRPFVTSEGARSPHSPDVAAADRAGTAARSWYRLGLDTVAWSPVSAHSQ